ncbi:MAG: hypothetical protein ACE5FU_11075 [Nitrospinota bacterium]
MDKAIEKVFVSNFESAQLIAERLQFSKKKLRSLFPLSPQKIGRFEDETQESVDALIKRFEQLEESIENKLFRGVLLLEQEDLSSKSKRDVTNLMEKFEILDAADTWSYLLILRNKLTNDYPNDAETQSDRINEVYKLTDYLFRILERLKKYVNDKKLAHI